ncbi:MAG TPA: hypothetical protein VFE38_12700 [Edaphobacter sp.]|nr:hypothetical protein [Edaphobacter sp.]
MIAAHFFLSGMWLQDAGSISSGNTTWLMVFVGLVALAMIVQAIALVVMAVGAAKARKRGLAVIEEVRAKAVPLIDKALPAIENTQNFIESCAPKLLMLAENMVETSNIIRSKAVEFDATLSEVNSKARVQAQKADQIASSVLDGASEIVSAVQQGIRVPVREFNGLVNGIKAGIDVLVGKPKGYSSYNRNGRTYPEVNDIDL